MRTIALCALLALAPLSGNGQSNDEGSSDTWGSILAEADWSLETVRRER